jgi:hypothetical protein
MKRRRTFERISDVLRDGSWHELDDLRQATSFPEAWVRELQAEGVVDTDEQDGSLRVRLVADDRVSERMNRIESAGT